MHRAPGAASRAAPAARDHRPGDHHRHPSAGLGMLCILPGIFLMWRFSPKQPALLLEQAGVGAAMPAHWDLTSDVTSPTTSGRALYQRPAACPIAARRGSSRAPFHSLPAAVDSSRPAPVRARRAAALGARLRLAYSSVDLFLGPRRRHRVRRGRPSTTLDTTRAPRRRWPPAGAAPAGDCSAPRAEPVRRGGGVVAPRRSFPPTRCARPCAASATIVYHPSAFQEWQRRVWEARGD